MEPIQRVQLFSIWLAMCSRMGNEGQEMIKSFPDGEVNNGNDGGFCVQMGVAEEEG